MTDCYEVRQAFLSNLVFDHPSLDMLECRFEMDWGEFDWWRAA